jgi:demethylmenaquinone methyltransferase/2-methoxy-6-polyprenyl-1,4-benzoquinol methylase
MHKGIQNIFSSVPATYELVNHILTLGFDTPVRRYAARCAATNNSKLITQNSEFHKWLDVCTGTGEMAHYLSKYAHLGGAEADTLVMASDFTLPMLQYASQKRRPKGRATTGAQCASPKAGTSQVRFTAADSIRLPFRDNTFDLITISFATRNINVSHQNLLGCLKEFHRVLKPGGRFINLETSQPRSMALRKLLHVFVKTFVKHIGSIISGSQSAYAYLANTIPRFYDADRFSEIILEAGFQECKYKRLLGGLAAIHEGTKKQ